MKFKLNVIGILVMISSIGFGQDSISFNWQLKKTYPIQPSDVWTADILENIYISHHSAIDKYDSAGVLKFSQSIKSLGESKQMTPINSMKVVHFSEEQQTLCLFDNTLTLNGDCKELIESEIYNASYVASSERSDKIWVYDNVNSNLKLIDLEGKTAQEIELLNLKGMLGIGNIIEIKERFNRLYILDEVKGVFVFDIYGSFIDRYEFEAGKSIEANEQTIFIATSDKMTVMAIDGSYHFEIPLPIAKVINIKLRNQTFFLRSPENVYKYTLQF